MSRNKYTTEHRKGQHLLSEEWHEIEVRLKDGWSVYWITKHLGRPYNTIKNEIRRGIVMLYYGKTPRYKADGGEEAYCEHRRKSVRNCRCMETVAFLRNVAAMFFKEGWSPDACVGRVLEQGLFRRSAMVCTKTLYRYIDLGLLPIKNIDLPEKLKRNIKAKRVRENKRNLAQSIEERPEIVNLCREFARWELDSVIGQKREGEPAAMTLTERKTWMCIWLKVRDHSAEVDMEALQKLFAKLGDLWKKVFKTITTDNGLELVFLSGLEAEGIGIYFTHPYASCEKGTYCDLRKLNFTRSPH